MICGWMWQHHGTCARAFEGRDTATGAGVPAFNFTIFEPPVTNVSADRFAAWYHTRRVLVPSASTPPVHLPGSGGACSCLPRCSPGRASTMRQAGAGAHPHDMAMPMPTAI